MVWDKNYFNPFPLIFFFWVTYLAAMILVFIVPCICASFLFVFRRFNASKSPSSVHPNPSIHLSFNVLPKGEGVIDKQNSLIQNLSLIHFSPVSSILSLSFLILPFVISYHLKSLGCGNRPPVTKRECRGATGWWTSWWSRPLQSGARQALHQSLVAAGTSECRRRWRQIWWRVWRRKPECLDPL